MESHRRSKTFYGLTNRRAIIVSKVFSLSTASVPLRNLANMSARKLTGQTGTLCLDLTHRAYGFPDFQLWRVGSGIWLTDPFVNTPVFELIPAARQVHDLIEEARRDID